MAQRYIKVFYDWPEGTAALSHEEKGRLIDAMIAYARGDPVQLSGNERFVFPMFKAQIDREADSYDAIIARNQANGSKGGRPKHNPVGFDETQPNPENPVGFDETQPNPENPVGFEKPNRTQKSQEKEKDKDERHIPPKSPKGESVDSLFSDFWSTYPRKVAKANALKAWTKLAPDEALTRQIIAAVEAFRLSPDWLKDNGAFIPHPATFLNGRRWEDELSPSPPAQPRRVEHDVADLDSLYA